LSEIPGTKIEELHEKLRKEAGNSGYYLNPDKEFTLDLVKSLLINEERFGYPACPCRLASGKREEDLDIICPCDYRDRDVTGYGACYCALYVSKQAAKGEIPVKAIPESRPGKQERIKMAQEQNKQTKETPFPSKLPLPVYRCKVCGYLCARPEPPDICPICKVTKDRFERFI